MRTIMRTVSSQRIYKLFASRHAFAISIPECVRGWEFRELRYLRACAGSARQQKWLDCSTNDIRSWPFLPRQISCLEPVSARDMQIALIYTGPRERLLFGQVGDCQPDWGGSGLTDVPEHRLPRFAPCKSYPASPRSSFSRSRRVTGITGCK